MAINISTSNLIETKEARIDGKLYKVRKLGAGDQLDISKYSRQLTKLASEVSKMQRRIDSGDDSVANLNKLNKALDDIEKTQDKIEKIAAGLFKPLDGGDSIAIIKSVGIDNLKKLLNMIFSEQVDK